MSKDKPAIAPVLSTRLRDYKLTKKHQGLLERFDKMQRYMAAANKTPPLPAVSGGGLRGHRRVRAAAVTGPAQAFGYPSSRRSCAVGRGGVRR